MPPRDKTLVTTIPLGQPDKNGDIIAPEALDGLAQQLKGSVVLGPDAKALGAIQDATRDGNRLQALVSLSDPHSDLVRAIQEGTLQTFSMGCSVAPDRFACPLCDESKGE